mgnify:CR=1 FL=1
MNCLGGVGERDAQPPNLFTFLLFYFFTFKKSFQRFRSQVHHASRDGVEQDVGGDLLAEECAVEHLHPTELCGVGVECRHFVAVVAECEAYLAGQTDTELEEIGRAHV